MKTTIIPLKNSHNLIIFPALPPLIIPDDRAAEKLHEFLIENVDIGVMREFVKIIKNQHFPWLK